MDLIENPHLGYSLLTPQQLLPHPRKTKTGATCLVHPLLHLEIDVVFHQKGGHGDEEEELCDTPCQQGSIQHLQH